MSSTIFQKVKDAIGDEKRSSTWYRNKVRQFAVAGGYGINPDKLILDERRDRTKPKDQEDPEELRKYTRKGRIFLFDYNPLYAPKMDYYDKFPLVYVIKYLPDGFYGINLHYLPYKRRLLFINALKENKVIALKSCIHRYLTKYKESILFEVAEEDWETAIYLPVDEFVTNVAGIEVPRRKEEVWQDILRKPQNYYRGSRIVGKY